MSIPQPQDFGLPKSQNAYHESCLNAHESSPSQANWTHPVVYQAAKSTGFFELKSMAEREVFPVFNRNYEQVCQLVMRRESLRDIPKALMDKSPKTVAEKNKAYHDAQQRKHLQESGLDQLGDPQEAMSEIYRMLGRN